MPSNRRDPRQRHRRWSFTGCPRLGPSQMRSRARPASLIAGWVHGGACQSGGGAIGPDRYLSAPIDPDRPRPVSLSFDRFRLVSVGLGRPRSVSVAPDRPRSVSIDFEASAQVRGRLRPIDTDRHRPTHIDTDQTDQGRSRRPSPMKTDRDRSRPIDIVFLNTDRPGRSGHQRACALVFGSGTGGVWPRLPPAPGGRCCPRFVENGSRLVILSRRPKGNASRWRGGVFMPAVLRHKCLVQHVPSPLRLRAKQRLSPARSCRRSSAQHSFPEPLFRNVSGRGGIQIHGRCRRRRAEHLKHA